MGLVGGVVALNAVLAAVGYCVLSAPLRGHDLRTRASYAGVAVLVGTALVFVVLGIAAPLGARIGLGAFLLACGLVAGLGLAVARWRRSDLLDARPVRAPAARTLAGDVVVTVSAFALVALAAIAVIGGFRSAAWLDDTWYFWLPKGRALDLVGLDPALWTPDLHFTASYGGGQETLRFIRPDNPLWFSMLLNLVMRFVGGIDMRAINGEMAILLVAFVGATARLLWGRVRASILLPALLVLFAAPELLRQAQGGAADVPLAIFLALALLSAAGWLVDRSGFALVLLFAFGAAAVAIKSEGLPELALFLTVLSVFGWREGRRLIPLWATFVAVVLTLAPWLIWRAAHGVSEVFSLRQALSPSYLSERTHVLHRAFEVLGGDLTSLRQWSLILPLAIVLGLVAAVLDRHLIWLAPATVVLVAYAFFVWASWADPEAEFRLVASAYRYVTPPLVLAGVFVPVLAEKAFGAARHRAAKT